jgi:DNA-binding NarL/FixJ family response regulator
MKKSILIVDNQLLFAEGLKSLFSQNESYLIKGIATSGLEGLGMIDRFKPDIVLMNCDIDSVSGIEVLKIVREHEMKTKVVFLSDEFNVNQVIEFLDFDVDGYLLKNNSYKQLQSALEHILEGNQYIEPSVLTTVNAYLAKHDSGENVVLTNRETEILRMIVAGYLNKEIGSELNISERTVKNHVSSLFKKMGVSDRTQAAVYAIKNNLVNF